MPSIRIPAPLRHYADNQTIIAVDGDTVASALDSLLQQYPDLRNHLYNGSELRNFINIYYKQEDIRYLNGEQTMVEANDTIMIVPSIAGG